MRARFIGIARPTTPRRRPAFGALQAGLLLLALSGCRVVGVEPTPAPPRIEVGPVPERPVVESSGATFDPVRDFEEVRALWVVRFTLTNEDRVREMVANADRAGFNTLIVQVRGRADAFYQSTLEPPGESIQAAADFDPLQLTIDEARQRGMAVHAWVNTHLVWGPAALPTSADHLVNAHPEWLAVPQEIGREMAGIAPEDPAFVDRLVEYATDNPGTVEGVYSSPSHPAVQDRVHAVWMDLARRYDLDGIHFDYIRFPSARFDYSVGALERFRAWLRPTLSPDRFAELDAAYDDDLYAMVAGEADSWAAFRREQVTGLVERIYRDVKAIRPRLTVSAAVIADRELALNDRFQDWPAWMRDGIVDVVVPMAYTSDTARFQRLVTTARDAVDDRRRVWAGIGSYLTTVEGTLEMIDVARGEGSGGIALFSYDWAVGEGVGDPSNPFLRRVGRERFGR